MDDEPDIELAKSGRAECVQCWLPIGPKGAHRIAYSVRSNALVIDRYLHLHCFARNCVRVEYAPTGIAKCCRCKGTGKPPIAKGELRATFCINTGETEHKKIMHLECAKDCVHNLLSLVKMAASDLVGMERLGPSDQQMAIQVLSPHSIANDAALATKQKKQPRATAQGATGLQNIGSDLSPREANDNPKKLKLPKKPTNATTTEQTKQMKKEKPKQISDVKKKESSSMLLGIMAIGCGEEEFKETVRPSSKFEVATCTVHNTLRSLIGIAHGFFSPNSLSLTVTTALYCTAACNVL